MWTKRRCRRSCAGSRRFMRARRASRSVRPRGGPPSGSGRGSSRRCPSHPGAARASTRRDATRRDATRRDATRRDDRRRGERAEALDTSLQRSLGNHGTSFHQEAPELRRGAAYLVAIRFATACELLSRRISRLLPSGRASASRSGPWPCSSGRRPGSLRSPGARSRRRRRRPGPPREGGSPTGAARAVPRAAPPTRA